MSAETPKPGELQKLLPYFIGEIAIAQDGTLISYGKEAVKLMLGLNPDIKKNVESGLLHPLIFVDCKKIKFPPDVLEIPSDKDQLVFIIPDINRIPWTLKEARKIPNYSAFENAVKLYDQRK